MVHITYSLIFRVMNTKDTSAVSSDDTAEPLESSTDDAATTTTGDDAASSDDKKDDGRSLTPATQEIVENFSKLTDQQKIDKLSNLEGSTARTDQRDAAKVIREMFQVPEGTAKTEPTTTDADLLHQKRIDELNALEEKLTSGSVKLTERLDREERKKGIKDYLDDNKIDASADIVLSDPKFWKNFISTQDSNLPINKRTKYAMMDCYGTDKSWFERQKKAASTSGMATGTSTKSTAKVDVQAMIDNDMTMEEYEQTHGLEASNR